MEIKRKSFFLPSPFFESYRKSKTIEEEHLPLFGSAIFESIFSTDKRVEYFDSLLTDLYDKKLVISIYSSSSTIMEIPFEILTYKNLTLLKDPNIFLVRRLDKNIKNIKPSKSVFNILFIISLPLDVYDKAPIDPLKEFSKIYDSLEGIREYVNIDILENASYSVIKQTLLKKDYDVIHFAGHGVENGLVIESDDDFNKSRVLSGDEIKELFKGVSAKAVILDACFTSSTQKENKQKEYFGTSVSSQFKNIPLVLANQTFVYDDFSIYEMESIYKKLFELKPYEILKDIRVSKYEDWWKPTLYLESNLDKKLFEFNKKQNKKSAIKTLNKFNSEDVYVYRYRPVRETLAVLRKSDIALLHGIGGAGKSHLADYIIEMLKGEFHYIIAIDVSIYSDIKSIKEYIGDIIFKEEMCLIVDNLETLLDKNGNIIDNDIEYFFQDITSEKFRGKVLFTSRIVPYFKNKIIFIDEKNIIKVEPYSKQEFFNLRDTYLDKGDMEIYNYLDMNFESFEEYDFYPLLISKLIEKKEKNIDHLVLNDIEIKIFWNITLFIF